MREGAEWWTWADVARRWQVGPRQARRVAARLGLVPFDLGHRTKRFAPKEVMAAEERMRRAQAGKREFKLNWGRRR